MLMVNVGREFVQMLGCMLISPSGDHRAYQAQPINTNHFSNFAFNACGEGRLESCSIVLDLLTLEDGSREWVGFRYPAAVAYQIGHLLASQVLHSLESTPYGCSLRPIGKTISLPELKRYINSNVSDAKVPLVPDKIRFSRSPFFRCSTPLHTYCLSPTAEHLFSLRKTFRNN